MRNLFKKLVCKPVLFAVSLYAALCALIAVLLVVDAAKMEYSVIELFTAESFSSSVGFTRSILLNVWSGVPLLLLSWLRYGENNLAFFVLFAPLLCASVAPAWAYLGAVPLSNYAVVLASAACYLAVLVEAVVAMIRPANRHV